MRGDTGRAAHPFVDAAVLGSATFLAGLPMLLVFGVRAGLPALAVGTLLGAGLCAVAARRGWGGMATLAVVLLAYLVVGPVVAAPTLATAGVLPSVESTSALLRAVVTVWKEVLTLDPELGASGSVLAAPLLLGVLVAGASVSVAARFPGRRAAWVAPAPVAALGVAVLLGTKESLAPVVAGVLLAALLLGWVAWRRGQLAPRRMVALALVAVALVGGGAAGPAVVADRQRFVLRDEMVPPFDPDEQASPLAAFRSFVKTYRETDLLTVRGLPEGGRVRLATMDAFDGVVWKVSGSEESEGSGTFRKVGQTIATSAEGPRARVQVEVHELPMIWLPTVGYAESFTFDGSDAVDLTRRLRYNDATGTAVLVGGIPDGTTYAVDAVVPERPDDAQLASARQGTARLPRATGVPDAVPLYAGDIAQTAVSPAEIASALADGLAERGYFSHGMPDEEPSLSGHGADRITTLLTGDLMVGDGEQYASAMALMAREMGLPSRVVMGFVPEEYSDEITFTGDDIQAWVEVEFAGRGWVAFDPTPDESRTPRTDEQEQQAAEDPQVRQPPPPLAEPVEPPDEDTEQPSTQPEPPSEEASDDWGRVLVVAAAAGVPLVVLLTPVLLILAAKRRRRRRRRTAPDPVDRVVGGWDELLDEARDLRRPGPATATRRETALHLASAFPRAGRRGSVGAVVAGLAASADAVVFGPGSPPEDHVAAYWAEVDAARAAMRAAVPRRRRLRARLALASLRHRRRTTRPSPAVRRRG